VERVVERRNKYRTMVGKLNFRPLARPMCRREDNIKKDVKEIWCKAVHFNELVRNGVHCQGLVNTVIKGGIS